MISKEDLQIGNIFLKDEANGPGTERYEVLKKLQQGVAYLNFKIIRTEKAKELVHEINTEDIIPYEMMIGLPLSEETLQSYGFQFLSGGSPLVFWLNNFHVTRVNDLEYLIYIVVGGKASTIRENLQYVHELQNHYFASTGQSLE